jgi:hypothetical protein
MAGLGTDHPRPCVPNRKMRQPTLRSPIRCFWQRIIRKLSRGADSGRALAGQSPPRVRYGADRVTLGLNRACLPQHVALARPTQIFLNAFHRCACLGARLNLGVSTVGWQSCKRATIGYPTLTAAGSI